MPDLRAVIIEGPLIQVAEAIPEQEPAIRGGGVPGQDGQQRIELLPRQRAGPGPRVIVTGRARQDGLRLHQGMRGPPVPPCHLRPGDELLTGDLAVCHDGRTREGEEYAGVSMTKSSQVARWWSSLVAS